MTTSTILERLHRADDAEMWQRFMLRFRRPLESFIRRFGLGDDQTEDVVQETMLSFLSALREHRYDRSKGRLSSWLFGIAYRQAANARRNAGRKKAVAADTGFWADVPDEAAASASWEQEWERATLEACMEQVRRDVSPQTFRAFEMIVREGRDPDAAAAELGMSRDAVYVAKHRVLKRLTDLAKAFAAEDEQEG